MVQKKTDLLLGLCFILIVTASRNMGLPPNVSVLTAIGLFSGFLFQKSPSAYVIPLGGLLLSDFFIGFHSTMPWVYGGFALSILLGRRLDPLSHLSILGRALSSSLAFYFVTNLGVWIQGGLYPQTPEGLVECYVKALPFFRNSLLSDLAASWILFKIYTWITKAVETRVRQKT